MVTVTEVERKSAVLTPSSLKCLSQIPTVNLTSGCAHGCLYCYSNGYRSHPGRNKVMVYKNTLKKIEQELARKRTKPQAVYFSPSSDVFQPLPEVLTLGHSIFELLLSVNIGVVFVTKGRIPDDTMGLLLKHSDKVRAQIGIITPEKDIWRLFEPNTADPSVRFRQMEKMVAGGIPTEARLVPVLPGITDGVGSVDKLVSSIADAGVKRMAVSTLFLRPAITESLRRGVSNRKMLEDLFSLYENSRRIATRAEHSSIFPLPLETRQAVYARFREAADKRGVEMSICACMNPDILAGTCNISGTWPDQVDPQVSLF